jgi:methionyl-tRNA synthetase
MLLPFTITQIPPLFPRIEEVKLVQNEEKEEKKEIPKKEEGVALIGIDDFFKTSIKIGTIVEANEIEKSDRLLLLKVDIGETFPRQVVAGIKEFYSPQDLLGTQICLVANLKPAKLMGNKSEGMILAAKDANGLSLIRPEAPKSNGTTVG